MLVIFIIFIHHLLQQHLPTFAYYPIQQHILLFTMSTTFQSQEPQLQDNHSTGARQHQQWVQWPAPEECAGWSNEEWLAWWEGGLIYWSPPFPLQDAEIEREASQSPSPDVEIKREGFQSPIPSIEDDIKQEPSPSPPPPPPSPPRVKSRCVMNTPPPARRQPFRRTPTPHPGRVTRAAARRRAAQLTQLPQNTRARIPLRLRRDNVNSEWTLAPRTRVLLPLRREDLNSEWRALPRSRLPLRLRRDNVGSEWTLVRDQPSLPPLRLRRDNMESPLTLVLNQQ